MPIGIKFGFFSFGGPDGSRTHDFYNANVALSQLSYRPVCKRIIYLFNLCVNKIR